MNVINTPTWCSSSWSSDVFTKELNDVYRLENGWSNHCNRVFESQPMAVFQFDKIRQFLATNGCTIDGKAVLVDPLTVFCLKCKKFLRLKRPNDIERYVLHLASHFDPDSSELMKFLQSGLKNGFQESSINQFSTRFPQISSDVLGKIRERYVHRDFDSDTTHYIAHWINKLLVSIYYTDY